MLKLINQYHIFSMKGKTVMKNLTILFLMFLFSVSIFPQNTLRFTLTSGDTITNVLKIPTDEIPVAIFCDSLTAAATVTPYFWVGDTAGVTKPNYLKLTTAGTSTVSTISLAAKRFTPLSWDLYYPSKGSSNSKAQNVWLFLDFASAQTNSKIIKVRTMPR